MDKYKIAKLNRNLFLVFFAVFAVTFFTRNNSRGVREIAPEVLRQPVQRKIYAAEIIRFTRYGFSYEVKPLYEYVINALIVNKMYYRLFSIYNYDKVFPMDLCLIWGSNVESGVFRNKSVKFSQDCRWCWAEWFGNVNFNLDEMSNNHLLLNNPKLERKIKTLVIGDQIKIKGKLVNVKANLVGKPGRFDEKNLTWNTSTTRTDSGAGACEVIYVEDLQILKKSNVISYYLFHISLYGLLALIIWSIFRFFFVPS